MSADKRSVVNDAVATLGTIIDANARRDAIHVACEPVQASCKLWPGQNVGVIQGEAYPAGKHVGIVDPFLKDPVEAGEWFWLLVYPRTITGLQHTWQHPDFPDKVADNPVFEVFNKEESEAWLREFCRTSDCPSYEILIAAITGREGYSQGTRRR